MQKVKITIEYEGEDSTPMVLRYDRASVDMSQDISIIGVCDEDKARFQALCEKYPIVERR